MSAFGQELQKLVQFLGVSEGQMQMGHMRFEPNINVHITDQDGNEMFRTRNWNCNGHGAFYITRNVY